MNNQNNTAAAPVAKEAAIPPPVILTQIMLGCFVSKALAIAAKLGVADLLAKEPQPIAALASATGSNQDALYRVLRALASVGVFTETAPKFFANTDLSNLLLSDAQVSMRDIAIWTGEEAHWRVYGEMDYSVRTGENAWRHVHGEDVFPYLFQIDTALGDIFNGAMTSFSKGVAPALAAAYDASEIETLVDVAGGHGFLLAAFLNANPQLKGVLFDLPSVIGGAGETLSEAGVANRVETVAGDFFEAITPGADAYMMKHIIHDWDDERSLKILENIRRAMKADGKVLIVEMIVAEGNAPDASKILDLEMLVSPGGKERTAAEYNDLLARAGFRLTGIIPTASPYSIIEAVKS